MEMFGDSLSSFSPVDFTTTDPNYLFSDFEWLAQMVNEATDPIQQSSSSSSSTTPNTNPQPQEAGVRKCTHCASEKTPQWRTGPLGPKTLCNACGVRFKSGRLVPEYRPAASPTFVLSQHSNSHRKVMELRRQKHLLRQQLS
ncbi:GATA transcription factor 2-like [Abrus precatorius]|uniref:GATA transcription factor 2-like n=1 Tax=Abrus precatorius TaxID=3816 RepID=A0A8B8K2A5_ABRPR|nr:GATA transcription factor 2-like [Abrus precatorius]